MSHHPIHWHAVALDDDLIEGESLSIELAEQSILLAKLNGTVYAVDDYCTHDGEPLGNGPILEEAEVMCPRHGARFCLRTGKALSAPAYHAIRTYPTRIHEQHIQVQLDLHNPNVKSN